MHEERYQVKCVKIIARNDVQSRKQNVESKLDKGNIFFQSNASHMSINEHVHKEYHLQLFGCGTENAQLEDHKMKFSFSNLIQLFYSRIKRCIMYNTHQYWCLNKEFKEREREK